MRKYFNEHDNPYYRSLRLYIKDSRISYRYPYQFDSDEFIQNLARFIEKDINENEYKNLNRVHHFYIGVNDGVIKLIEKEEFDEKEKNFLKSITKEFESKESKIKKLMETCYKNIIEKVD